MTTQFVNIVQDGVPLEIEYEILGFGTAAARLEIHDILHKGESINDLLVSPDPVDALMMALERRTVKAWVQDELSAPGIGAARVREICWTGYLLFQQYIPTFQNVNRKEARK
jgi:hypothetical protein